MLSIKKSFYAAVFFLLAAGMVFAQKSETPGTASMSRGSIPEELLRPRRGEAPRYPVDTVIGPLGQGKAPDEAFAFARRAAAALAAGRANDPSLSAINSVLLEGYLSALGTVEPRSFRLGGGQEEADGAVSFLVRFIGRELSVTGELFIRYGEKPPEPPPVPGVVDAAEAAEITEAAEAEAVSAPADVVPATAAKAWRLEELILEESRSRESENEEGRHRFDFSPYERFF
jgi:hypothetical protein